MKNEEIFEIAPGLKNGPLSNTGMALIKEVLKLPQSPIGDVFKTMAAFYLFEAKEEIFKKDINPIEELKDSFIKQTEFLKAYHNLNTDILNTNSKYEDKNQISNNAKIETGSYYGNLFKNFDAEAYFNEATEILRTRLQINNIFPEDLNSKTVLDAGCGGGKYSAAWKKLGAGKVIGVDFSKTGIEDTRARIAKTDIDVEFQIDSVLDLSFKNDTFDVVFCNGVLHHTNDYEKGISEIVRVLKKDGMGWIYMIEKPGGYFWDIYEILRVVMKDVDDKIAEKTLKLLNLPAHRIFRILDHLMVSVNKRSTPNEIHSVLENAGAKNIKRLERGVNFDRIEKIYKKEPYAEEKYGVGENIFVFSK